MTLDRIKAGWRTEWVTRASKQPSQADGSAPKGEGSVFEQILASGEPDSDTYILWRGDHCFALLNLYPYGSGHILILPKRQVQKLGGLTPEESTELWAGTTMAVQAIEVAYEPDGVNVGMNLGRAGGAGIPDHLHMHCLPRWAADTNFMTSIGEARVLPETMESSWSRLLEAWPSD